MTDEQINTAIAEACGWEVINNTLCNVRPDRNGDPEIEPIAYLPDYCNDLNATHEMEQKIPLTLLCNYWDTLREVCTHQKLRSAGAAAGMEVAISATARQRAEAFLRTLGKWEEEETK